MSYIRKRKNSLNKNICMKCGSKKRTKKRQCSKCGAKSATYQRRTVKRSKIKYKRLCGRCKKYFITNSNLRLFCFNCGKPYSKEV